MTPKLPVTRIISAARKAIIRKPSLIEMSSGILLYLLRPKTKSGEVRKQGDDIAGVGGRSQRQVFGGDERRAETDDVEPILIIRGEKTWRKKPEKPGLTLRTYHQALTLPLTKTAIVR